MNTRLLIVVGVCLVTGVGSGTTWSMRKAASERAQQAQESADSLLTAEQGTPPDSRNVNEHAEDTATVAVTPPANADSVHGSDAAANDPEPAHPGTDSTAAATTNPAVEPGDTVVAPGPGSTLRDPAPAAEDTVPGRPSRIFGAMRPEEAARIIEGLDDRAALTILLGLSDRKVAAILAKIKGDRAASLARALLSHEGVG